jgi:hypothetical protein
VAFSHRRQRQHQAPAGAQNFDHINVFIDGVGQKNNILRGGLTGQDSSRGNPFPQSAIAEYRVLTQNYKAEFEQVSSAAITAITKSGTNELQRRGLRRPHRHQLAQQVGVREGARSRRRGAALVDEDRIRLQPGRPIVKDQMHFFFAYDGKEIGDSRQVVPRNLDKLPAGQGIVPTSRAQGSQVDKFTEHLLFGKIDAPAQRRPAPEPEPARVRREDDRVPESRDLSMPGNDKNRSNDETRLDLKHEWNIGAWLSEARIGYEDYTWNPQSASSGPFIKYKVSTASPQQLNARRTCSSSAARPTRRTAARRAPSSPRT